MFFYYNNQSYAKEMAYDFLLPKRRVDKRNIAQTIDSVQHNVGTTIQFTISWSVPCFIKWSCYSPSSRFYQAARCLLSGYHCIVMWRICSVHVIGYGLIKYAMFLCVLHDCLFSNDTKWKNTLF
jgi:hypothetical protein